METRQRQRTLIIVEIRLRPQLARFWILEIGLFVCFFCFFLFFCIWPQKGNRGFPPLGPVHLKKKIDQATVASEINKTKYLNK